MDIVHKRVLILAPHTDDGEFGAGATIHKLSRKECEMRYIAFSDCQESIPTGFSKDSLKKEMRKAVPHLGIPASHIELRDFPVRRFHAYRQDILDELIKLRNDYNPEIVFTPATGDIHQDHQIMTAEAIRAFKNATILGYELPWNLLHLPSTVISKITEQDLAAKIKAIQCYKTQQFRPYAQEEYIKSLAITRGVRIGSSLAEAFEAIRVII